LTLYDIVGLDQIENILNTSLLLLIIPLLLYFLFILLLPFHLSLFLLLLYLLLFSFPSPLPLPFLLLRQLIMPQLVPACKGNIFSQFLQLPVLSVDNCYSFSLSLISILLQYVPSISAQSCLIHILRNILFNE
jgi:hypothetical protein